MEGQAPPFIAEYYSICSVCRESVEPGQVARMGYDGAEHASCSRTAEDRPACEDCGMVHARAQKDCE